MLTAIPGGHLVDPFNPHIFMPLPDVLTALDNICRYSGKTGAFYSVLNHSLTLAGLFENDPDLAKQALIRQLPRHE